jgi:hypothetical protein
MTVPSLLGRKDLWQFDREVQNIIMMRLQIEEGIRSIQKEMRRSRGKRRKTFGTSSN